MIARWKCIKTMNRYLTSVYNFVDILAQEMLDQAFQSQAESTTGLTNEIIIESNSQTSASSFTACTGSKEHTKVILKGGKQLRCMWCRRVNLVERKIILKCLEYGKVFCRDIILLVTSCYVGGGPKASKTWYKKEEIE